MTGRPEIPVTYDLTSLRYCHAMAAAYRALGVPRSRWPRLAVEGERQYQRWRKRAQRQAGEAS